MFEVEYDIDIATDLADNASFCHKTRHICSENPLHLTGLALNSNSVPDNEVTGIVVVT